MAYQAKTVPTDAKVQSFVDGLESETRRRECAILIEAMQRLSGSPPLMWGPSIIGFGHYDYRYDSGHSGSYMRVGFSPRKEAMTVYIVTGFDNKGEMLERLGPHRLGKSCLYIKDLSKVDLGVLDGIIALSLNEMAARYP